MTKKERAKQILIRELSGISTDMYNGDYTPDEAMDAIMEMLQDYEEDTGDTSVRKATEKFYTADQIKEQISEWLKSQDKPTEKTLQQVKQTLSFTDFSKYWYLEEKKHYSAVREKDVDGLVQAMLNILDKEKNAKKRKELIDYLAALDFTDTVDVEEDYRDIINKCINYGSDTADYRPRDFCDKWIVPTYKITERIRNLVKGDLGGKTDLSTVKRMLEKCTLTRDYYQKFLDDTYTDLSVEGLEWLRGQLIAILEKTK